MSRRRRSGAERPGAVPNEGEAPRGGGPGQSTSGLRSIAPRFSPMMPSPVTLPGGTPASVSRPGWHIPDFPAVLYIPRQSTVTVIGGNACAFRLDGTGAAVAPTGSSELQWDNMWDNRYADLYSKAWAMKLPLPSRAVLTAETEFARVFRLMYEAYRSVITIASVMECSGYNRPVTQTVARLMRYRGRIQALVNVANSLPLPQPYKDMAYETSVARFANRGGPLYIPVTWTPGIAQNLTNDANVLVVLQDIQDRLVAAMDGSSQDERDVLSILNLFFPPKPDLRFEPLESLQSVIDLMEGLKISIDSATLVQYSWPRADVNLAIPVPVSAEGLRAFSASLLAGLGMVISAPNVAAVTRICGWYAQWNSADVVDCTCAFIEEEDGGVESDALIGVAAYAIGPTEIWVASQHAQYAASRQAGVVAAQVNVPGVGMAWIAIEDLRQDAILWDQKVWGL